MEVKEDSEITFKTGPGRKTEHNVDCRVHYQLGTCSRVALNKARTAMLLVPIVNAALPSVLSGRLRIVSATMTAATLSMKMKI